MTAFNKNIIIKIGVYFIILFLFNFNVYSLTILNGAGGSNGGDGDKSLEVNPVENLVIQGAVYYLQSCSDIQIILQRIEQQAFKSVDYTEMLGLVGEALDQITSARETYERLLITVKDTPTNPVFIQELINFDYHIFMKEYGLIEGVFTEVEGYLSQGDIIGLLTSFYERLKNIEIYLRIIKRYVSAGNLPSLSIFWKLNETCAEASLFGSYATRVFHAVL